VVSGSDNFDDFFENQLTNLIHCSVNTYKGYQKFWIECRAPHIKMWWPSWCQGRRST